MKQNKPSIIKSIKSKKLAKLSQTQKIKSNKYFNRFKQKLFHLLHKFLFHLTYLLPILTFFLNINPLVNLLALIILYARTIGRYRIKIQTFLLQSNFEINLTIISDLHLGVYKSQKFLQKIIHKIQQLPNSDLILIAGDFTYYPSQNLNTLFSPFKQIKTPIYGVLGNHDHDTTNIQSTKKLQKALLKNQIKLIDNKVIHFKKQNFHLIGLGDHNTKLDNTNLLTQFKNQENIIILTHNPDTTLNYPLKPTLTIAGHTHGGQIRIPLLYKKIIPCKGPFTQNFNSPNLYISQGIGETLLPLRLFSPPTITQLNLKSTTSTTTLNC